jgi:uncharacterized HAD superfamily protein
MTNLFVERGAIAWDVDDTLCHFMAPVLSQLYQVMGKEANPEQLVTSHWLEVFLTPSEIENFLPHVFNPQFYMKLEPTAILDQRFSPEFRALHDKFDFHVVTARRKALGRAAHRVTSDWLHQQEMQVDGVTICHPDQPKAQVMPMNTIAVVDDSSKVVLDAAERGVHAFLIDKPWNRKVDTVAHKLIHRVTHETCLKVMAQVFL